MLKAGKFLLEESKTRAIFGSQPIFFLRQKNPGLF
jgi:hypothetical protein